MPFSRADWKLATGNQFPISSRSSSALLFANFHFSHHITLANGIDRIHAIDNFAKYRVLAIQVALGTVGNKELATIAVGA